MDQPLRWTRKHLLGLEDLSADEIRAWIVTPAEMTKKTNATRKPPMRAYASLPKEDLDALVAFLVSKKK